MTAPGNLQESGNYIYWHHETATQRASLAVFATEEGIINQSASAGAVFAQSR